jgi:hypothetical protein
MMRVALVLCLFAAAFVAAAKADDYGPHRGVREVRAAVPILVQARLDELRPGDAARVDDAIVGNDAAIVDWHSAGGRGISALTYGKERWWLRGTYYEVPRATYSWWLAESTSGAYGCPGASQGPQTSPTADSLIASFGVDRALAGLWSQHGNVPAATHPPMLQGGYLVPPGTRSRCDDGTYYFSEVEQRDGQTRRWVDPLGGIDFANTDGYRATWTAPSDWAADLVSARGRAPTAGEMTGNGANAIAFLYATIGLKPIAAPKTSLAVWCPFVLDPDVRYIVEFAGFDTPLGPIPATVKDNVLHFDMPAFGAPAGASLQGEVDFLTARSR